mmetsp:Transcript_12842/g.14687  ORF Transcript_12842/g.14687 Transcript_12842/m.14687 type:complete len:259 (-) Transcript_12842:119-895(-)
MFPSCLQNFSAESALQFNFTPSVVSPNDSMMNLEQPSRLSGLLFQPSEQPMVLNWSSTLAIVDEQESSEILKKSVPQENATKTVALPVAELEKPKGITSSNDTSEPMETTAEFHNELTNRASDEDAEDACSSSKRGKNRWSKKNDRVMFKIAIEQAALAGVNIEQIARIPGKIQCKATRALLNSIKAHSNWTGTLVELKKRIVKITTAEKFTDREVRILKKLIKMEKRGQITMAFLLEQFPGKTIDHVIEFKKQNRLY